MSAICFVCNLPILSHQVGLVWKGGNGADEFAASQPIPIRRRDSSSQIATFEPPSPPGRPRRRRRSSLAQLTDLIRDWGRGGGGERKRADLSRRETLADFARSLPFGRRDSDSREAPRSKAGRRQSLADAQFKSRRAVEPGSDLKTDISKLLAGRDSVTELWRKRREIQVHSEREELRSRRESAASGGRRDSKPAVSPDGKYIEPRALIEARQAALLGQSADGASKRDGAVTLSAANVSEGRHSPTAPTSAILHRTSLPTITPLARRGDARPRACISPEPTLSYRGRDGSPKQALLRRQATAFDEGCSLVVGGRRGSRPYLSPDPAEADGAGTGRGGGRRRDSLSPDSAAEEMNQARRMKSRRQSSEDATGRARRGSHHALHRSPEGSSTGSSREPSPNSSVRRQSTTEEILIAKGFRRQSTTEDIIRCRNFRRQSTLLDEAARCRGRRDSATQILDGTVATMTVESAGVVYDTSTQTEQSSLYDNNQYHEECLRCNSCGQNLTGTNQKRARRHRNNIYCDLHFADLALMESSDFMNQLRAFKPQSLGCAVARRKSSTTLIFPLPPQACSDEFCRGYPHNLLPTPGYWIECAGQPLDEHVIWDADEGEVSEDQDADLEPPSGKCNQTVQAGSEDGDDYSPASHRLLRVPTIRAPNREKTPIEEHFDKYGTFELTSIEQETFEKYFYGTEHWNYFTQDEDLGPIILSLKQETINGRDQFRIMVRAISYTVHGLVPASCVFADRYNREEVVRSLGNEINLNPPLLLSQLPDIPEELLKLDQVFIKSELKVGVVYVKEGQYTEEEILENNENSRLFDEFLSVLGDKVRLKGFDKYKGGLDTVHDLTGLTSVYTHWRGIEIMFHVSTLLPYEEHDAQKLQRKRHIGNDIVCVVFLEADNTSFSPACIKSHFLHTFIVVRTSPKIKFKPTRYEVSVVSRDEVGAYKPYLWEQSTFEKGALFREWICTKIVNGERASYSAPKFARMQERTRSQMLEDIVTNVQNHAETGQIPKPYRRGSWRPIGHMRPSSPLLDSVRDLFEGYDQLAKDFTKAFHNPEEGNVLYDVTFLVGQGKQKTRMHGVRAILGVRSRVFQEMLYGFSTGFGSPQVSVADILARAVPTLHSPSHKPKSSNFLQVPDIESPRPKSVPNSPMVIRAFNRLGSITAGWGRTSKKPPDAGRLSVDDRKKWASNQDCSDKTKVDRPGGGHLCAPPTQQQPQHQLAVPRLSVCADEQKVDRSKLCQSEFMIIEFEADTFGVLLDYLHHGSCPLTCTNVPGLICAAEHYDLPELLQACFHHAKQFLRVQVVCAMLGALENYYWRYTSASELVNMILAFIETRAAQVFQSADFLGLSESMVQMIMSRNLETPEIRKFEVMLQWTKHKVRTKAPNRVDARIEFKCTMERLTRDLKLYRISPQELIKIVLPSKAIKNERILETLMFQANSGMYRIQDSYLEACQQKMSRQDSKFSSEWGSFDNGL
ncbi:uncharacterized protein LOC122370333 [Amphibalanus amphitrite]|uniref:uncharacterized protein LOC122370333 n=1 Tax=Amphibalanus amphitrite TaxID=1232801 RepID=UPI001C916A99|nr:uncharacterized protein LOC122370333 [Amphibalanus amphitrite]